MIASLAIDIHADIRIESLSSGSGIDDVDNDNYNDDDNSYSNDDDDGGGDVCWNMYSFTNYDRITNS